MFLAIISAMMGDLITRNQVSVRGFKLIKNPVYTLPRDLSRWAKLIEDFKRGF